MVSAPRGGAAKASLRVRAVTDGKGPEARMVRHGPDRCCRSMGKAVHGRAMNGAQSRHDGIEREMFSRLFEHVKRRICKLPRGEGRVGRQGDDGEDEWADGQGW